MINLIKKFKKTLKNINIGLELQKASLIKQDEILDKLNSINLIIEQQNKSLQNEILNKVNSINNSMRFIYNNSVIGAYQKRYGIYTKNDGSMLKSSICRMQDLLDYEKWVKEMGQNLTHPHLPESTCVMNRKAWEYVFIAQALYERDLLQNGKKGLGFAVGNEPLSALFAKYGCEITATDIDTQSDAAKTWIESDQHGDSLDNLYKPDICDKDTFNKNVSFKFLDMNNITDDFTDYDFCWSSCAFEHLGSIERGKQFIYNMLKCLKPGGVAVHTTEFNLSSYFGYNNSHDCIFGYNDFMEMRNNLIEQGHKVEDFDLRLGNYPEENFVSYIPHNNAHFKLNLEDVITTSFALIIQKQ